MTSNYRYGVVAVLPNGLERAANAILYEHYVNAADLADAHKRANPDTRYAVIRVERLPDEAPICALGAE